MKKSVSKWCVCVIYISLLFLVGCGKKDSTGPVVKATGSIEVAAEILNNVSVTLPEGITRENVSNIQHDFIQNGKQVGGIVILDIPNEMLDSPYDSLFQIPGLLGQQLMPDKDLDDIAFIGAGGNDYAYMEISTGNVNGTDISYVHNVLRGKENNYDVWFDYKAVKQETINAILASISSDDISAELNKSAF